MSGGPHFNLDSLNSENKFFDVYTARDLTTN